MSENTSRMGVSLCHPNRVLKDRRFLTRVLIVRSVQWVATRNFHGLEMSLNTSRMGHPHDLQMGCGGKEGPDKDHDGPGVSGVS